MEEKNYFRDLKGMLLDLSSEKKRGLILGSLTLFFLFFSYPMIRSAAEAIFLDLYGAKKSPHVWFYSIIALSVTVTFFNKFQANNSIHRLFWAIGGITAVVFTSSLYSLHSGTNAFAYIFYIWKEVYIVLMVHTVLAFINSILSYKVAKTIYGPMGALGSIGGILGGIITSRFSADIGGAEGITIVGTFFVLVACLCFQYTGKKFDQLDKIDNRKDESPLHSILEVKKYVFLIAIVIILSQFCINLTNFKFNILLERFVHTKAEKVSYLGNLYSSINGISLFMQILIIPLLFNVVKNRTIHFFIPVFFFLVSGLSFSFGSSSIFPVMLTFVLFKGTDYSLFAAAKEMLYFPLIARQKYGAKYVVDMLVYRMAKGVISLILVFYQSETFVEYCLGICLIAWFFVLIPLFRIQEKVLSQNKECL